LKTSVVYSYKYTFIFENNRNEVVSNKHFGLKTTEDFDANDLE